MRLPFPPILSVRSIAKILTQGVGKRGEEIYGGRRGGTEEQALEVNDGGGLAVQIT